MPLRAVVFDLDGTLIDSRIDYEKMASRVRGLLASEGAAVDALGDMRKVY